MRTALYYSTFPAGVLLSGCGAGVITSEDVSGPEAAVIGLVIVAGLLFVAWVGGRGR
jgi:hypothetical protein